MSERGEFNLGQLARQRFGKRRCSSVSLPMAARSRLLRIGMRPAERKNVRPGHPESYEALFHEVDVPRFYLESRKEPTSASLFAPNVWSEPSA